MKICNKCGSIMGDDDNSICLRCGSSSYYEKEEQNAQMYPQQNIGTQQQNAQMYSQQNIGTQQQNVQMYPQQIMGTQQQYTQQNIQENIINSNNKEKSQETVKYIYVKSPSKVGMCNGVAIASSILCFISLFVPIVRDWRWTTADIAYFAGDLTGSFGEKMTFLLPLIQVLLAIFSMVIAFVNVKPLKIIRDVLICCHFFGFFSMLVCLDYLLHGNFYRGQHMIFEDYSFGMIILIISWIVAVISHYTSHQPPKTIDDAPRMALEEGISNSNSRGLSNIVKDQDIERWVCPKCDAKNTSSICKVCGYTKH